MYCRSGNRSEVASNLMRDLGFADVAELDGGVLSWASTGLSLVGGG
jgi:phage shock protein E